MSLVWVVAFRGYSQTVSSASPNFSLAVGGSYNFIDQRNKGLQTGCYGTQIGFISEKALLPLNRRTMFWLGLFYNYRLLDNYENAPFFAPIQREVHLTTNIKQHTFDLQLIAKYRSEKKRFSAGAGIVLSYLFMSQNSQTVNDTYDSATNIIIQYKYHLEKDDGIHAFDRFNISPVLNAGIKLSPIIDLEYFISYGLIAPSQIYLNYNSYQLLNNTLCLTFKIN